MTYIAKKKTIYSFTSRIYVTNKSVAVGHRSNREQIFLKILRGSFKTLENIVFVLDLPLPQEVYICTTTYYSAYSERYQNFEIDVFITENPYKTEFSMFCNIQARKIK